MLGVDEYEEEQNGVVNTHGRKTGGGLSYSQTREGMEGLYNLYVVHSSSAPGRG